MNKIQLQKGDIVQVSPEGEHTWGGFFCVVTEPKEWGCQGYLLHHANFEAVRIADTEQAYVRLKFEDIEYCGRAFWVFEKDHEEQE